MSSTWPLSQLLEFFIPRIFFAILCGGIVGLEREIKNKPAGIKTNILICLGSTLYTTFSILIATDGGERVGDPGRLAAQIIPGIGFIGGGAIIKAGPSILGMTTAATIWLVAAVGVCIGIGHPEIGVLTTVTTVLVLVGSNFFEDRVLGRSLTFGCEILAEDEGGNIRRLINESLAENNLVLDDFDVSLSGRESRIQIRYSGHRSDHKKFVLDLWSISGIREVKQQ